jgi:hypothetical protein
MKATFSGRRVIGPGAGGRCDLAARVIIAPILSSEIGINVNRVYC